MPQALRVRRRDKLSKQGAPARREQARKKMERAQKVNRAPIWIRRGLAAEVICPFKADFRLAVGSFRLTRLKALVASPRSWNVNRSKWKSRNTPRSISR